MTEKEFIKKLQTLTQIRPDQEWVNFCYQDLIHQLDDESYQHQDQWSWNRWLVNPLNRLVVTVFALPQPPKVVATLVVMAVGFSMVVSASQRSLPGDGLYPLKLAFEKSFTVVPGEENQAKLHTRLAERRIKELEQFTLNAEVNAETVLPVLEGFKKEISATKETLTRAAETQNGDAVKFAKLLTEETTRYQASLLGAYNAATDEETKDTLKEAIAYTEDTRLKALTVITSASEGNQEFTDELRRAVETKIENLKQRLATGGDGNINNQVSSLVHEAETLLENGDTPSLLEALELVENAEELLER